MIRVFLFFALSAAVCAQGNIQLKDGRVIPTKAMRREKDTIVATIEIPAAKQGDPANRGDFGFPLKEIVLLQFERPAALDIVPQLLAEGRASDALDQLDPVIKYYGGFRDAPGSWWADAVPLQIQSLLALKRDDEAIAVAEQFARLAVEPEIKELSRAFSAIAHTKKGEHEQALGLYREATKATERQDILAMIAVNKGESLLALGNALYTKGEIEKATTRFEEALLNFLRISALYPSQREFLPQATLGAARAYLGIKDFTRARTAINELKESFPKTPEAKESEVLAEKVEKMEKQLAEPDAETT